MEIFRSFRLEASHSLPALAPGHPCRKVHGHSWQVEVAVSGPVSASSGWVMDFADLESALEPLRRELDHAHLNEVAGLENPTSENLALWIWRRIKPALPGLSRVAVSETTEVGCVYRGEHEAG